LDVGEDFIEVERIRIRAATPRAAEDFGQSLAATHAAGAEAFGTPPAGWGGPCFIGRIGLPMGAYQQWGEFYAELRVWPYADRAHRIGNLDAAGLRAVEAVCRRLTAGDFDDGLPPARIHG